MEFKVEQKVRVIDYGEQYTCYKEFIEKYAPKLLDKWEDCRSLPEGGVYTIQKRWSQRSSYCNSTNNNMWRRRIIIRSN